VAPKKLWEQCLTILKSELDAQSIKTWFEPVKPMALAGSALTIQVPNKFFYQTLEERFVSKLGKALVQVLGKSARLEYQILVENHRKIGKHSAPKAGKGDIPKGFSSDKIKNPFIIPGIKKMTSFNPLLIFGDVGLGKTHLAQAIGNQIVESHTDKQVLYVTTERFTNQVIQAIKNNAVADFMNFYQMVDTLIVDDIHFLSHRPKTQEIFFNIFNHLHQNGKQIILTSDRAPKDLADVEERLISRFKWGLSAELTAPDYQTRLQILDLKMKKDGLVLEDDIKEYICYNMKNNVRELEGVLITLVAQSTLNKKQIDMALAKSVVKQFVSQVNKEITVDNIKLLVADYFEVPVEKLHGKTRKRDVVIARQLSMYLAKHFTNSSLKVIGDKFGGRDHSTVIYSVKAVQDMMDTDLVFKDKVVELEKQVQLSLQ